jgi:predicted nucleic acid-binding protein
MPRAVVLDTGPLGLVTQRRGVPEADASINRYLPLTTTAMRLAAELWARARNAGVPTADARSLDADVILAAQVLATGIAPSDVVVASVNVRHIARFVASDVWSRILP